MERATTAYDVYKYQKVTNSKKLIEMPLSASMHDVEIKDQHFSETRKDLFFRCSKHMVASNVTRKLKNKSRNIQHFKKE